jgi:hypothetical protein
MRLDDAQVGQQEGDGRGMRGGGAVSGIGVSQVSEAVGAGGSRSTGCRRPC